MNSFDDRYKKRCELEDEMFDESFRRLSEAATGVSFRINRDDFLLRDVMEEIAEWFGLRFTDAFDSDTSAEKFLEKHFRSAGIMWRKVRLKGNWYREATGIMLGALADGRSTGFFPSEKSGYSYRDPDTGKKRRVTSRNVNLFQEEAILFYRPLPQRKIDMADIRSFLWRSVSKKDVAVFLFATFLTMLLGMLTPAMSRLLLSTVTVNRDMDLLLGILFLLLSVTLTIFVITVIKQLILVRIGSKAACDLQAAVMMRTLTAPAEQMKYYAAGDLGNRIGSLYRNVRTLTILTLSTILTAVFSFVCFIQMFLYAPALAGIALAVTALLVALCIKVTMTQVSVSAALMDAQAEESGLTYDLIDGMQKISLAGAQKRSFAIWADVYRESIRNLYNPPLLLKVFSILTPVILLVASVLMYFVAVRTGTSTVNYFAFASSYGIVTGALTAISQNSVDFARALPVFKSLLPVMELAPETGGSGEAVEELGGEIALQNVTFGYDKEMPPVIDDVSFTIRGGEYVAVTGSTGCGKSTLLRLLLGFEKPDSGEICYDGRPISSLDVLSLRKKIGTVLQNGEIIQGTIFSNITITDSELSVQDAWDAAETAGIAEDIRSMPLGMNTPLPAGGMGVSGGQKQRLLIARAIAGKPRILFFDEATSALDNITQKEVSDAVGKLKCTRLIFAHRLSTIKDCDRILCMDNGKIAEEGTYEELLAKNGLFAELVKRQQI